ncbi:MAG: HEAT repeat protein [Rhodothermales bacterium]|jgi:HEAT repeat protein
MRNSLFLAFILAFALAPVGVSAQSVQTLTSQLSGADAQTRGRAACQLGRFRAEASPAVSALVVLLADEAELPGDVCRDINGRRGYWYDWNQRGGKHTTTPGLLAAEALGEIGEKALPALHQALAGGGVLVRHRSILAIAHVESPASIEVLAGVVRKDAYAEIRADAAWALGSIEDPAAIEVLSLAATDASPLVREKSVWALGALEEPAAVPHLAKALADKNPEVRSKAAWALGAIEALSAVDPLLSLLSDNVADVRQQAAWALGAIGDRRATAALIAAMDDSDLEVRRTVAWALGAID